MDVRTARVGVNEELFRQVNEQVHDVNEAFGELSGTMTVVCECGDRTCIEQIQLRPEVYVRVRAEPELFVVKPGHVAVDLEFVVEDTPAYQIIRKRGGQPAQLARDLDDRR
jgi:hypothetical protein